MSFSEDCVEFGDRLAKLVDAGVSVKEAAAWLGLTRDRCYAILRATGRPVGAARSVQRDVDSARVVAVFKATGSVNQAAKANNISHGRARQLLVDKGLVDRQRQVRGRAQARARFFELLAAGSSSASAAREVGVHVRTARDWRDGVRKVNNTRIRPDGTVITYGGSGRYNQPMTHTFDAQPPAINSRYLSLQ